MAEGQTRTLSNDKPEEDCAMPVAVAFMMEPFAVVTGVGTVE